jgi:hypothetical protein
MSGHTPAPWGVESDPWHYDTRSVVCAGLREKRAGVDQRMIVHVGGWADVAEQEANARLISAAPDLLAALEAALTVLPDSVGAFDYDAACAAIAKARGEA